MATFDKPIEVLTTQEFRDRVEYELKARVSARLTELFNLEKDAVVSGIVLGLMKSASFERLGNEITLTVKMEGKE